MTDKRVVFWLIKKIISLVVLVVVVIFVLNFKVRGRPIQDYLNEVFRSPLIQEVVRQGKEMVMGYLHKDIQPPGPAMEKLEETERKELEKVLEKETKRNP